MIKTAAFWVWATIASLAAVDITLVAWGVCAALGHPGDVYDYDYDE